MANKSKPHYKLLDGLRGVAALLVVWYHVHEGFSFAGGGMITGINHGYLAVDFFFIVSGYMVISSYRKYKEEGRDVGVIRYCAHKLMSFPPLPNIRRSGLCYRQRSHRI